jgi:excisionase family DNA binding protein
MAGPGRKPGRIQDEKALYGIPKPKTGALTVREAAVLCGKNPETIRRWVWTGKIEAEKVGNQLFIDRSQIDKSCIAGSVKKAAKSSNLAEFIREAKALREKIWKETGTIFDAAKMIEESRASRDRYE